MYILFLPRLYYQIYESYRINNFFGADQTEILPSDIVRINELIDAVNYWSV
jgi:hypothetical protein